jgi:hypothetical protein
MSDAGVRKVTFVAYEGFAGNDVVKSQVVGLAREIARRGIQCTVVVFERLDRYFRGREEARELVSRVGGLPLSIRVVPRLHGSIGLALSALALRSMLSGAEDVVHCRGVKGVTVVLDAIGTKSPSAIVGDFRGAEPEEAVDLCRRGVKVEGGLWAGQTEALEARLSLMERRAVAEVDHALCVSQALADHLVDKHGVAADKVSVVHCGASATCDFDAAERARIRRDLDVGDELLLCHLGGLSAVHRPDRIASFVSGVAEAVGAGVSLLVLSRDAAAAEALKTGLPEGVRLIVRSVPSSLVCGYLAASDAGLLMLDSAFRNEVSFPVKYSEYACSGLPVIMTSHARDPAEYVQRSAMGVLVEQDRTGGWNVTWPEGMALRDAVIQSGAHRVEERHAAAVAAARVMRFDYTSEDVLGVYRCSVERKRRSTA